MEPMERMARIALQGQPGFPAVTPGKGRNRTGRCPALPDASAAGDGHAASEATLDFPRFG